MEMTELLSTCTMRNIHLSQTMVHSLLLDRNLSLQEMVNPLSIIGLGAINNLEQEAPQPRTGSRIMVFELGKRTKII